MTKVEEVVRRLHKQHGLPCCGKLEDRCEIRSAVLAGLELAAEVAKEYSDSFDDTIDEARGYGHPEETIKQLRMGKGWTADVAKEIRALAKEPTS
jgi:hypothetical protein